MKRERCGWNLESGTDPAGRKALRSGLYERSKYVETRFLGQCGECGDGGLFFHDSNSI